MLATDYKNWHGEKNPEILKNLAIEAAIAYDWTEAVRINKKIVGISQTDVEALNRLAKAQACCSNISRALKTYKKVLTIDPYNIIAKKNFEKLSKLDISNGKTNNVTGGNITASYPLNGYSSKLSDIFLFEPGKTKIISLLNLAPPFVLAKLNCGDKIAFSLKKHGVYATCEDGTYLGALPDDFAHKLLAYIDGGNKYEIYVKFATAKTLTVFIREAYRSQKFSNQPSFPATHTKEEKSASVFA